LRLPGAHPAFLRPAHLLVMRPILLRAALSGLFALLAACSSGGDSGQVGKLSCPAALAAPGLDAFTVFRPGTTTTNPEDIGFGVKLISVKSTCRNETAGLRVITTIAFIAARNDDNLRQGDFTYFVAIADQQQTIVAKQYFALRVDFALRQKQMRISDEITEHLPLKNLSLGSQYAVIVGLQPSQQQLDKR
jgi:hypothetical protein